MNEYIAEEGNRENTLGNKFEKASLDTSTYRNCAGFVSYMLEIDSSETLKSPQKLAKELEEIDRVELDSENTIPEETYLKFANESDAAAIFVENKVNENPKTLDDIVNNTRVGLMYVHFVYIDPNDPKMIYERPDIEKKPIHTKWDMIFDELEEFKESPKYIVFFKKA